MIKDFFSDNFSDVDAYSTNDNLYPFIDHKNDKECLEWLNKDINDKVERSHSRLERIRQLVSLYKGINYRSTSDKNVRDTIGSSKAKDAKIFVNFVNEMVEAKTAQRSRFKPSIVILPNNDEIKDTNNAQTAKQLLDCKSQEMDFEKTFSDGDKIQFLRGESYTWILWDKVAGGINPIFKKFKDQGLKIPGKTDPMNGDFVVELTGPERSFLQIDRNSFDKCNDISRIEWIHIDELKALHPNKEKDITADEESMYYDSSDMTKKHLKNHCMVVHYYHKVTRFMPNGAYVKYIRSCILEKEDLTVNYKHGKLPVIFDTDIDLDGELHGRPFVDNIARLQSLHNMVMASMAKSFAISANPKWVYPDGTVSINKLTNEYGSLSYKGTVAPQLVSFSGINKDSYALSDKTEKHIQQQSSVYGISRGEPPKGIKAAVALQFLDEQELQRESRGMGKRQRRILDVYKMCLQLMSQHYTKEDGRIFKMLGADNSYLIKTFNLEGVSNYDIRMQNSSSLPDSKTGKIAAILDINQATAADPYFGKEEISNILDMGNDQRFKDKFAVSVKAANTVIQKIMDGVTGLDPNEWDDFIVQYPIFLRALQEREYKDEEKTIADELVVYITSMEYLMMEKIMVSPQFKARVDMFYMFPTFYKVPPTQPPIPGQPGSTPAGPTIIGQPQEPNPSAPMDLKQMQKTNSQDMAIQSKQELSQ